MARTTRKNKRRGNTRRRTAPKFTYRPKPAPISEGNIKGILEKLKSAKKGSTNSIGKDKIRDIMEATIKLIKQNISDLKNLNLNENSKRSSVAFLGQYINAIQARREQLKGRNINTDEDRMWALKDVLEVREYLMSEDDVTVKVKDAMDELADLLGGMNMNNKNKKSENVDEALDDLLSAFGGLKM